MAHRSGMPPGRGGELWRLLALLLFMPPVWGFAQEAGSPPPSSAGPDTATDKRDLPAVRFATPPTIDGDLSDACWQGAARADRFTDALDGRLAPDQTVALVGYDAGHIYVAFHAFDSQPNGIVSRETKRGAFPEGDDIVAVSIDPFHAHQNRSFFLVNPLGTQFARLAGGRASKLEWEGAWKAAARTVADGWVAEMAIPWSILNYPAAKGPTTVGINFDRRQARTKVHSWWSNIGLQEFTEKDGHWVGVQLPPFRRELSLLPYVSSGWQAERGRTARSGLDVRSRLSPTLTLVGTVNPDFANVEEAVEGIDFSYGERFIPDRRPFFQEGQDTRDVGGLNERYFYSRRIGVFDTGVNLYGKVTGRDNVGLLTAVDLGHRSDWVLSDLHEFGPTSLAGLFLFNRDDERESNRVALFGGQVRKGLWRMAGIYSGSWVNGGFSGDNAEAFFEYQSPRWNALLAPLYIDPGYRHDLGFIPFTGFKGIFSAVTYRREWRQGPLRSLRVGTNSLDTQHYDGALFQQQRGVSLNVQTRGDLSFDLGWDGGRFEEFDDSVFSVGLRTRASDPFHNYGLRLSRGRRAGDPITFLTPSVTWRFGQSLTVGLASALLYHQEDLQQHVFTFNYDFSPRRGIVGRIVSQTGGTNGYLAYRRSGYGGVETYLIVGDPNGTRFDQRVMTKVVWPL
jgi:hypothetical protein